MEEERRKGKRRTAGVISTEGGDVPRKGDEPRAKKSYAKRASNFVMRHTR